MHSIKQRRDNKRTRALQRESTAAETVGALPRGLDGAAHDVNRDRFAGTNAGGRVEGAEQATAVGGP